MPTSELSSLGTPPISITCSCGKEMKLVSVEPRVQRALYAYQCESGHRHEITMTDT
jgi:hypothetical protein